ncbi:hypothetical protein DERP_013103 [Dermatophagoides pteronyssinus]|uniref:Uncharacterized protein n=1 Tax=Dermatophagoides pteronyssinus TaxID=6956 RepID=A0ABQ8J5P7_DERPT|nr:hypothetical protein DERP_013103 [Dermatophagoides pteronyssinus]
MNCSFQSNCRQPIVDEHDQHSLQLNSKHLEQDGGYELENHLIRKNLITRIFIGI